MTIPTQAKPQKNSSLALILICAATLMTVIDETIVTVAAPSIKEDLSFSGEGLSWVVNAYLIGFGGVLLLAGRLGDLFGRGRVMLTGMSVFTIASVAAGLAQSPAWLVIARFAQGVGGAFATSVALGMITYMYRDESERTRAIGTYAVMGAIGASSGLFLGGIITSALDWRWAFFVNLPIGIVVVTMGAKYLDREQPSHPRRSVDWLGAGLLVTGLMALVGAIVMTSLPTAALAGVLLVSFVARQAYASEPILPLGIFRSRMLVAANAAHALFVGAMFTFQFLITLYLQQVLGFSPAQAGLGIVPIAAGIALFAMFVHPRVSARYGTRPPLLVGLTLVTAGLALLTQASAQGGYWTDLFPSVLLFAVGGGLTLPSMMTIAMSAAPTDSFGLASGLLNTSQQAGGAVGLASFSAIAAAVTAGSVEAGSSTSAALVDGYQVAWGGAAGLAAVALLIAAVLLRVRPNASGDQTPPVEDGDDAENAGRVADRP